MLKVIQLAIEQLGYLEKKTNSDLDDKTANAGYGNYTKYGRDMDSLSGWYNGKKNGYPWCAQFVDWLFVMVYGRDLAAKMLNHGTLSAGCVYASDYYRSVGRFYTGNPQAGDQIFFGSKGNEYHTGIVEKVENGYVYTIEGNTSSAAGVIDNGGGVFRKSYSINNSAIGGYGRPDYSLAENASSAATPAKTNNTSNEGGTCTVELKVLGNGSTGKSVKSLQILLNGLGYNCGNADGCFGPKTLAAVRNFQKANNLDVDGKVGPATWGALLK